MVTLVVVVSGVAGCAEDEPRACPDGWTVGGGLCAPPEGYREQLAAEHGSAVFGYMQATVGDCAPVVDTVPWIPGVGEDDRDCHTYVVADHVIEAYPIEALGPDGELAPGAVLVATATSAHDGHYVLPLAVGTYALATVDPVDGQRWVKPHPIEPAAPVNWWYVRFDHGAD